MGPTTTPISHQKNANTTDDSTRVRGDRSRTGAILSLDLRRVVRCPHVRPMIRSFGSATDLEDRPPKCGRSLRIRRYPLDRHATPKRHDARGEPRTEFGPRDGCETIVS